MGKIVQPRLIVLLLILAGAVDMWTVASAPMLIFQIGAGVVAGICFIAAGLIWERQYDVDRAAWLLELAMLVQQPPPVEEAPRE